MIELPRRERSAIAAEVREHARDAWLASLALPPPIRDGWIAVLAFRLAVRATVLAEDARALDDLAGRVAQAYAGDASEAPLDRALAWLATEHELPRACFDAQLEAARWDLDGRRHHTIGRVLDYAVRRTGSVAVAAAALLGRRKREPLERAVDLGVAFELTRIATEVGRDAAHGHVYLPIEWLEDAGVDVDRWLARPHASPEVAQVVRRVASEAERFYLRADPGMALVPLGCRSLVRASRWLGVALLRELEATDWDSVRTRSRVGAPRAMGIAVRALRAGRGEGRDRAQPPLEEARWLVDAATR